MATRAPQQAEVSTKLVPNAPIGGWGTGRFEALNPGKRTLVNHKEPKLNLNATVSPEVPRSATSSSNPAEVRHTQISGASSIARSMATTANILGPSGMTIGRYDVRRLTARPTESGSLCTGARVRVSRCRARVQQRAKLQASFTDDAQARRGSRQALMQRLD